jgi:hypothetical protein
MLVFLLLHSYTLYMTFVTQCQCIHVHVHVPTYYDHTGESSAGGNSVCVAMDIDTGEAPGDFTSGPSSVVP